PLFRGDDDGARDRGQGRGVLAVTVVGHQLVDLAADDGPLIGGLALADPLLERVPVDARAVHPRLLRRLVLGTPGVAEDLELHQAVDIFGGKAGLVELDAELFHTARRAGTHG